MERLERVDYLSDWLAICRNKSQEPVALHGHPLTELVIVKTGRCTHLFESERFPLTAGDVFVVHRGLRHGYADTENFTIINLLFDVEGLGLPLLDLERLPGYHALFTLEPRLRGVNRHRARLNVPMDVITQVDEFARQIEHEVDAAEPGSLFSAVSYLMQIIVLLSRAYSRQQRPESVAVVRLGTVLSFLSEHYAESTSVGDLATMAHMSERGFYRTFRAALECSPAEYRLRLRLNRVAELLRTTDLTLQEIAARTGMGDGNYLSRQFRKHFSLAPSTWRGRMRDA